MRYKQSSKDQTGLYINFEGFVDDKEEEKGAGIIDVIKPLPAEIEEILLNKISKLN